MGAVSFAPVTSEEFRTEGVVGAAELLQTQGISGEAFSQNSHKIKILPSLIRMMAKGGGCHVDYFFSLIFICTLAFILMIQFPQGI